MLVAVLILSGCTEHKEGNPALTPTGLTIVALDQDGNVIDSVAVEESVSRVLTFRVPPGQEEIRVFALGERVFEDYPKGSYLTGRPDDETWMGLGYVQARVEDGILTSIDSNGIGTLSLNAEIEEMILKDLSEGLYSPFTTVGLSP